MILSINLNQTTHKNQGRQYDIDRLPGKIHKVQRFTRTPEAHKPLAAPQATRVQGSPFKD